MSLLVRTLILGLVLSSTFGAVACGTAPTPTEEEMEPDDATSGPSKPSSSTKPSPSTSPTSSTTKPTGPGPSTGPEGTTEPVVPVPDDHVPVIDPDYPGIDIALTGEEAPSGCEDGFDAAKATVSFVLSVATPGVRLHVEDGILHANGNACQDDAGEPLRADVLRQISVRGGGETNLVILDFSVEPFGETILAQEGGFRLDGGQGDDALYMRGSAGDDEFYAGAANQRFVAALSDVERINLFAKSFEAFRGSFGPGDDTWLEIGRLNVGLYDLDSGSVLRITGIDIPQRLWGGDGHDQLNGGALDDVIVGGLGDDLVNGRAGNDKFDEESGANGKDVINGGPGLDEVNYGLRSNDLVLDLCEAPDELGCGADCACDPSSGEANEEDTLVNVEAVRAGGGDDVITGGPSDNYIYAGDGNDQLFGGAGSDVLQGAEGNDEFDGQADEDICDADEGETALSCEV